MYRILILIVTLLAHTFSALAVESKTVAITQIAAHPSLDKIRQGILDTLVKAGFKEGENLNVVFDNAQGNPTTAAQIAQKYASLKPDVAVAITTPSAQTAYKALKPLHIPLVFAGVTDPVAAKLLPSLNQSGQGITGSVDRLDARKQLAELVKINPLLKRLGVLYSSGEANSVSYLGDIKSAARDFKIEIIESSITKTPEVGQATQSLVGRVDAVLIPTDNTVVSALESVVKVAKAHKLPVYVSDPDSLDRGADGAVFIDQYELGVAAGQLAAQVLAGKDINQLKPTILEHLQVKTKP